MSLSVLGWGCDVYKISIKYVCMLVILEETIEVRYWLSNAPLDGRYDDPDTQA